MIFDVLQTAHAWHLHTALLVAVLAYVVWYVISVIVANTRSVDSVQPAVNYMGNYAHVQVRSLGKRRAQRTSGGIPKDPDEIRAQTVKLLERPVWGELPYQWDTDIKPPERVIRVIRKELAEKVRTHKKKGGPPPVTETN